MPKLNQSILSRNALAKMLFSFKHEKRNGEKEKQKTSIKVDKWYGCVGTAKYKT